MNNLPFFKVQSIGNDFVLFRAGDVEGLDLSALAQKVCARHYSVGSDGMLVLDHEGDHLTLRMFNPDGSEDFCGNGLRCAAWFAFEHGLAGREATIHHLGKVVHTSISADNLVSSEMDGGTFAPEAIPSLGPEMFHSPLSLPSETLTVSTVSTGSAHTILFVDALPDDDRFLAISPLVEHHPMFPERTSLMWTQVEGSDKLKLRIWERGAGETMGCGTGSAAAAIVYLRTEGRGGSVEVQNPGGLLVVRADKWDGSITLVANAQVLYAGKLIEAPEMSSR